jgi:hypothetical protein
LTGKLFLRWRLGTPTLQIHLAYLTAAAFPADAARFALLCCCRRRLLFFLPCLLPVHYSLSTHIHGAMAAFDLNVRLEEDDDDGFDLNNGTVTLLCLASCRPCLLMAMLLWFAFPCLLW